MDKVGNKEMNLAQISDAQLWTGIVDGDRQAFRKLYDRYEDEMYRLALRKLHSQELAEEIVQDVFVELWEKRHTLTIKEVRFYLFRSVKNGILDQIRAQIVRQNYQNAHTPTTEPNANQTDDSLALYELMAAIYAGMDNLSEKTSEIFRFNRLEALSPDEIASILSLPKRTVEYHITIGLRAMRVSLKDYLPLWIALILQ